LPKIIRDIRGIRGGSGCGLFAGFRSGMADVQRFIEIDDFFGLVFDVAGDAFAALTAVRWLTLVVLDKRRK
jgi:hypothetical protein